MSSKRQRAASSVHSKPEPKEEPQAKRVRKEEKDVPAQQSQRKEGPIMGGLPMYGEMCPKDGYTSIPTLAANTCSSLRQAMEKVKNMKASGKDIGEEGKTGLLLFSKVRKLNRLSHLFTKETRDRTHQRRLEVDGLHLQLQNLRYEAMHLDNDITNCLQFRSQHEEIELISEEDFYHTAPETISRPEVTTTDDHQRMLGRLEWELQQRKQLADQLAELEGTIKKSQKENGKLEEQLGSLRPTLEKLKQATQPAQEFFSMPLDWEKEQHSLALLLPPPLYVLYVQAEGYSKVEDDSVKVEICGEPEEAKSFQTLMQRDQSVQEDSDSDQEGGGEETSRRRRRKKRHVSSEAQSREQLHSRSFPLSVHLTLTVKGCGRVTIIFQYLPFFSATCALVTNVQPEGLTDSQTGFFSDKSLFLHCLYDKDSGRTSPNTVVSQLIRKYGGDTFSSAVRQYGFPYRWVQRVCGANTLSEGGSGGETESGPDYELSAQSIVSLVDALKKRMKSQVQLVKELSSLDQKKADSNGKSNGNGTQCQLIRWKSIAVSEVQTSQFGGLAVFNLQERTNRLFLATIQHGQARMHAIVCVAADYPHTPPVVAVLIELTSGQKQPYDIHMKNIEIAVNLQHPKTASQENLLSSQMQYLRECFDRYMQQKTVSSAEKASNPRLQTRGKGRLLSLS